MKQKEAIILFVFLISMSSAFCQKGFQNLKDYDYEQYHFGFLLGYNKMGFSINVDESKLNLPNTGLHDPYSPTDFGGMPGQTAFLKSAEPKYTAGFTIGIIGNLRLTEHFDLRIIPALSFGERNITYNYLLKDPTDPDLDDIEPKSMKSTLLELPLHLKYKGNRINNARPYILAGIKYARDLSSDAKKSTQNLNDDLLLVKLKQDDLYGELGAGFDFYFDWFKMGLEAKMSYGFNNMIVRDNKMYTTSINRLNSKIFQLSVTFE